MTQVPFSEETPRYHQIAQALRARARGRPAAHAGDPQGARPHTEQALCAEFGVSRTTIRQALAVLKREGLLESRRGVGTRFVPAAPEPKYTRSHGDPLHAALGSKPRLVSRKVVRAPDPVVEFLGLGEEKALRLVRINDLEGAPLSVVVSYLPGRLANAITRSELRRSVHEVLWRRCGLRQKRSVHTIDVERADAEVALFLEIGLSDPVLHIRSRVFLEDGSPIRWTDNYFREGRYEYTAEMVWEPPAP